MSLHLTAATRNSDSAPAGSEPRVADRPQHRQRLGGKVAHREPAPHEQADVSRTATCADEPTSSGIRTSSTGELRPKDGPADRLSAGLDHQLSSAKVVPRMARLRALPRATRIVFPLAGLSLLAAGCGGAATPTPAPGPATVSAHDTSLGARS